MSEDALPRIDPVGRGPGDPAGVALVLHGGQANSRASTERKRLAYLRMLPFARVLARADRRLGVYLLRYRYRGWNHPSMDALRDAQWALNEIARRHSDVPVVLVGHSMGGRAALHAAGAPNVRAVAALAPWLDGTDPVRQLAGRTALLAHGDLDTRTDPRRSYAYAVAARAVTDRVCRFEMPGGDHAMLRRAGAWHALVRRFVLGELGLAAEDPVITQALRAPTPDGLRVALVPPG
jgi:pimeloyl-ACP methyl ester carboxylesterase